MKTKLNFLLAGVLLFLSSVGAWATASAANTITIGDVTWSGTFANAQIPFATPNSIGNTTPASGAFTTLTAKPDGTNADNCVVQVYTSTADSSDESNTTSEISMVGTGTGSMTIPSAGWAIGKKYYFIVGGYYTTAASPTGSWTMKCKLGSNVLWSQASLSRTGSLTKACWSMKFTVICRATGSSGSLAVVVDSGNKPVSNTLTNSTSPVTVNLTTNQVLDFTITNSGTDASEHCVGQCVDVTSN